MYILNGPNNNFYGIDNVTIVSTAQQINSLMFSMRNTPTRPRITDDLTRQVGTFLLPPDVIPMSSAAIAARAAAAEESEGGARKSRRRNKGIRRKSRKASRARKTKKRKSKRRRTMKRK